MQFQTCFGHFYFGIGSFSSAIFKILSEIVPPAILNLSLDTLLGEGYFPVVVHALVVCFVGFMSVLGRVNIACGVVKRPA